MNNNYCLNILFLDKVLVLSYLNLSLTVSIVSRGLDQEFKPYKRIEIFFKNFQRIKN